MSLEPPRAPREGPDLLGWVALPLLAVLLVLGAMHRPASPTPPPTRKPAAEPVDAGPPAPAPAPPKPVVGRPEPADAGPLLDLAHLGLPVERALALGKRLEPLQVGLPRPQQGDWLTWSGEEGQSFREYVRSEPARPSAQQGVLYVAQLGELSEAQRPLVDAATEALGLFYGVPVKRMEPLALSLIQADDRRDNDPRYGEQLYTGAVLDLLEQRRPRDAVAVVAFTASDVWPGGGWNFVFGQAKGQVGIYSLARLGNPAREAARVMRRTVQVALHETGHMLGIMHCTFAACGMNGSNSLAESDRHPVHFCAEDEMKVFWACPVDPVARYRALAAFAERHGLAEEARYWAESAEALAR